MSAIERHQVPLYFAAVLTGSLAGLVRPDWGTASSVLLWPMIAALLFCTFLQVPFVEFRQALADWRFLAAILTANFLLVPLVVGLLLSACPLSPPVRLGVALVLLTPCTDWMNTFTWLGQGDAQRTLAATPVLLFCQFLLLPVYLALMLQGDHTPPWVSRPFLEAFLLLVALPLVLAALAEWLSKRYLRLSRLIQRTRLWPVWLLAGVVMVIAASEVQQVLTHAGELTEATSLFVIYVLLAAGIGWLTVRIYDLPPRVGRGVIFSTGTRNSFVVLPLALSLPAEWGLAVPVIVIQAFVEMLAMLAWIRLVPAWLLPEINATNHPTSAASPPPSPG